MPEINDLRLKLLQMCRNRVNEMLTWPEIESAFIESCGSHQFSGDDSAPDGPNAVEDAHHGGISRVETRAEGFIHHTDIITKQWEGRALYGIRVHLGFRDSVIAFSFTFWVPWTAKEENDFDALEIFLDNLMQEVRRARTLDLVAKNAPPPVSPQS